MSRSLTIYVLTICGIIVATLGCRSTGNVFPGFKWAGARNRVSTEAPVAMKGQTPDLTSAQFSGPVASTVGNDVSADAAPTKDDPLRGFYPEDLPESTNSTSGFASSGYSSVPTSGSFPSSSSAGCSSGCCPH